MAKELAGALTRNREIASNLSQREPLFSVG
jgi:hypothetical protein